MNKEWLDLIDSILNSDEPFNMKAIKRAFKNKYDRNFGTIIINDLINILKIKYKFNKKLIIKMLNVRSNL